MCAHCLCAVRFICDPFGSGKGGYWLSQNLIKAEILWKEWCLHRRICKHTYIHTHIHTYIHFIHFISFIHWLNCKYLDGFETSMCSHCLCSVHFIGDLLGLQRGYWLSQNSSKQKYYGTNGVCIDAYANTPPRTMHGQKNLHRPKERRCRRYFAQ
jgi:hypothetical protein